MLIEFFITKYKTFMQTIIVFCGFYPVAITIRLHLQGMHKYH